MLFDKALSVASTAVFNSACPQYVPSTSQSSLIVAVRVRPLLKTESTKANKKDIIRVLDDRVVVVLDPDESKVRKTLTKTSVT